MSYVIGGQVTAGGLGRWLNALGVNLDQAERVIIDIKMDGYVRIYVEEVGVPQQLKIEPPPMVVHYRKDLADAAQ